MRLDKIHEITETLSWDWSTWRSYGEVFLKNPLNVTFLEAHTLGYIQALLFNYNKLFPVLKEIIHSNHVSTLSVLTGMIITCENSVFMQVASARVFLCRQKIFAWQKFTISHESIIHGNHITDMQWDTNITQHCTIICGWGVDWCIVLQFVKKSLQVFSVITLHLCGKQRVLFGV